MLLFFRCLFLSLACFFCVGCRFEPLRVSRDIAKIYPGIRLDPKEEKKPFYILENSPGSKIAASLAGKESSFSIIDDERNLHRYTINFLNQGTGYVTWMRTDLKKNETSNSKFIAKFSDIVEGLDVIIVELAEQPHLDGKWISFITFCDYRNRDKETVSIRCLHPTTVSLIAKDIFEDKFKLEKETKKPQELGLAGIQTGTEYGVGADLRSGFFKKEEIFYFAKIVLQKAEELSVSKKLGKEHFTPALATFFGPLPFEFKM